MHELSICTALLETILRQREVRGFKRVCRVKLEIGSCSCLDPDALRYAFEVMSRETFLENAVLEIDRPLARAVCRDCGTAFDVDSRLASCPHCLGSRLRVSGGDGMRLIEMAVV